MQYQVKMNKVFALAVAAAALICLLALLYLNSSESSEDDTFDFVPENLHDCDELFGGTPVANFPISHAYNASVGAFQAHKDQVLKEIAEEEEGHSNLKKNTFLTIHYIASRPQIKTYCETGFNLGHSAFNVLTSSPQTVVYSFDLGNHKYARPMAKYLEETFKGRITVIFGDSTETVPQFLKTHPDLRCDFINVDGGHTYPVAIADLRNFASIPGDVPGGAPILFDDYPSTQYPAPLGAAWEDMKRWGYVVEKTRCYYGGMAYTEGFITGRVVKKFTL